MKKIISFALSLILLCSLFSCDFFKNNEKDVETELKENVIFDTTYNYKATEMPGANIIASEDFIEAYEDAADTKAFIFAVYTKSRSAKGEKDVDDNGVSDEDLLKMDEEFRQEIVGAYSGVKSKFLKKGFTLFSDFTDVNYPKELYKAPIMICGTKAQWEDFMHNLFGEIDLYQSYDLYPINEETFDLLYSPDRMTADTQIDDTQIEETQTAETQS